MMGKTRKLRILLAKPGLDGHDVGAKIVARSLIDAGFEVRYTGLRQSPEDIVIAARDFEADVIALSILSGSHLPICTRLKVLIDEYQLSDRLWIAGGNIPAEDHQSLHQIGVDAVFNTSTSLSDIVAAIKEKASEYAN
ncbi:MAG: methylmalonyl-CoA mutase [Hyphomicrobiales bacterium]|nr:methylmalonyl-CoA mutase [Hyphomicrobiales bacterium]